MNLEQEEKLIIERIFNKIGMLYSYYKIPFLVGIVIGILAHMYAMTNKLPNHDDVINIFDKGCRLSLGRWGLDLMSYIFPDFSMPWIYGILSIVLISVSACIIVNILDVNNKIFQVLVAGLTVSFPSLTGTFSYMFTSTSYALSFFLACLAVHFVKKGKFNNYIFGIISMVFSLGIYQSYIAIASSLLLLVLFIYVLRVENFKFINYLKMGGCYLLFLVISLIGYYGIVQICFAVTKTSFASYIGKRLGISEPLVIRLKNTIAMFIDELLKSRYGLVPTVGSRILTLVGIAIVSVAIILRLLKKYPFTRKIATIIVLGLFPVSVNCMYIFADSSSVHTLVQYSFVTLYFLMIVIAVNAEVNISLVIKNCMSIIIALIVIINIYIANEAYLCMNMRYENTYSFYTSLVTEIKQLPEFERGCKIALIGDSENCITNFDEFDDVSRIIGVADLDVNMYTREQFVQKYIGFDIEFATEDEIQGIKETQLYADMESYPYYGSIQRIDDYIVVKFD